MHEDACNRDVCKLAIEIHEDACKRGTSNVQSILHEVCTMRSWIQSLPSSITYVYDTLHFQSNSIQSLASYSILGQWLVLCMKRLFVNTTFLLSDCASLSQSKLSMGECSPLTQSLKPRSRSFCSLGPTRRPYHFTSSLHRDIQSYLGYLGWKPITLL